MILPEYSYNVPKRKTDVTRPSILGQRGGSCPCPCRECVAKRDSLCRGCNGTCPDMFCPATHCEKCVNLCCRAEKTYSVMNEIGGLGTDTRETEDLRLSGTDRYIPAINKKLKWEITGKAVSVPFYAVFDFEKKSLVCSDVRDFFRISTDTKVLINFYMKDDKIFAIYDMIKSGVFWKILRQIRADTFFTVCFSVFEDSSGMDILLNFKRQFHFGDVMRDMGFNVIQETLFSGKKEVSAGMEITAEIINRKGIRKISQNTQLTGNTAQFRQDWTTFSKFFRLLNECDVVLTGYGMNRIESMVSMSSPGCTLYFSNYIPQFRTKSESAFLKMCGNFQKAAITRR